MNFSKLKSILYLLIVFIFTSCSFGGDLDAWQQRAKDKNNQNQNSKQFNIIIFNNSIYPITAIAVHTDACVGADNYGYTSIGFIGNLGFDSRNPINMLPEIYIEPGEYSDILGPFRILFRSDRANPSLISAGINYFDSSILKSVFWSDAPSQDTGYNNLYSGYWYNDVPDIFLLEFNGEDLLWTN